MSSLLLKKISTRNEYFMKEAKVIIEPYSPEWAKLFEQERQMLQVIVNPWLNGTIEHVGSTAVPGLSAKPVIDIMIGVKSLEHSTEAISELANRGYCYTPYKADVMHWLCKPSPEVRTHHLYLIPYNSPLWYERIKFRDLLRANQEIASEYQKLKIVLAEKCKDDREAYTQNKWPFITAVLANGKLTGK